VSKGSRQNRSVPLVKRLALRIGQLGTELEIGFSCGGKMATAFFGLWKSSECYFLVNVRSFARLSNEFERLYEL